MSMFVTKTIETLVAEAERADGLRRVLGRRDLVALGVGAVIGAGIFVLTGQAAAAYADPAIVVSMAIAGLASALAGLCYAEFASAVPVSGSAYTYAYATLGEFAAWLIGWDLILEYALSAATVAVSWSGHFGAFLCPTRLGVPGGAQCCPRNARRDRERAGGDGCVQSPRGADYRDRDSAAAGRHTRVGGRERRDGGAQGRRDRHRHCRRHLVRAAE
jgi:hypothetical protein